MAVLHGMENNEATSLLYVGRVVCLNVVRLELRSLESTSDLSGDSLCSTMVDR